jgi:hypothetical protein
MVCSKASKSISFAKLVVSASQSLYVDLGMHLSNPKIRLVANRILPTVTVCDNHTRCESWGIGRYGNNIAPADRLKSNLMTHSNFGGRIGDRIKAEVHCD